MLHEPRQRRSWLIFDVGQNFAKSESFDVGKMKPSNEVSFEDIFTALRSILERNAGALEVSDNSPTRFCLEGGVHPKHKKPMPIAWAEIGKSYVSFHHMGIYARPELLEGVSKELKARMQGKSCFNFTSVDRRLFIELEKLTVRGFDAFKKLGFMQ
jgi:hypothetical protein